MADVRVGPRGLAVLILACGIGTRLCGAGDSGPPPRAYPSIPRDYLLEAPNPPDFWVSTVDGVAGFLRERVRTGKVEVIGASAGGRPIRAVIYGHAREGKGTTTFSGAIGAGAMRAYFGPDFDKRVYLAMASVHGGNLRASWAS